MAEKYANLQKYLWNKNDKKVSIKINVRHFTDVTDVSDIFCNVDNMATSHTNMTIVVEFKGQTI